MSGRGAAGPGLRCERAMIRHDVDDDGFSRGERLFQRRRYVGRFLYAHAYTSERFRDACEVHLAEAPHFAPALVGIAAVRSVEMRDLLIEGAVVVDDDHEVDAVAC